MKKVVYAVVFFVGGYEAAFASSVGSAMAMPLMIKEDSFTSFDYCREGSVVSKKSDLLKEEPSRTSASTSIEKRTWKDDELVIKDRMNDAKAQIESMLSGFGTPEENVKTVESIFERLNYYKSMHGEKLLKIPEVCDVLNMLVSDAFFKYYEKCSTEVNSI